VTVDLQEKAVVEVITGAKAGFGVVSLIVHQPRRLQPVGPHAMPVQEVLGQHV